ncbi:MAG: TIM barrel protein [Prolixibacteraceae bacterium]|jgi:sugar phosphate isomerase/epimerase|nr:TIM barrel protein [Prolixibacteraceae bacterium]MBT6007266.1 TIM barrel protein [Prolixibacteraceae bacterium]MBT6767135.1 TIM barrel protein [Prolixibacteraceae bacterium]MBT7000523.1 TIM barrel protein [Prolixibacteraceae bacterium]MBT7393471.1 TIM barrel protein [Prolixibacteraceae bacterium]
MIYVSSACSKKTNIRASVLELVSAGIQNIELSGGTEYSETLENDLIELQLKHNLNFLLHNYFPPPQKHFVLNLASENQGIREKSLKHIKNAINLSEKLKAFKYGVHAGFFIDPNVNELGKNIDIKKISGTETGTSNFVDSFLMLNNSKTDVKLYIENNVISKNNYTNFAGNPFMLTNSESFNQLQKKINFNLLLDVAHLKVSCNSLNLRFEKELQYLLSKTDYIHLSDNCGQVDSNNAITKDSEMFRSLKKNNLKNKTICLEIYSGLNEVLKTIELLKPLVV